MIQETFRDSHLEKTVCAFKTPPDCTTSGDYNTAADLQKPQTTDTGINPILIWVLKRSHPPRFHLEGLPRKVSKLWNLFDELTIRDGNFARGIKILKPVK